MENSFFGVYTSASVVFFVFRLSLSPVPVLQVIITIITGLPGCRSSDLCSFLVTFTKEHGRLVHLCFHQTPKKTSLTWRGKNYHCFIWCFFNLNFRLPGRFVLKLTHLDRKTAQGIVFSCSLFHVVKSFHLLICSDSKMVFFLDCTNSSALFLI